MQWPITLRYMLHRCRNSVAHTEVNYLWLIEHNSIFPFIKTPLWVGCSYKLSACWLVLQAWRCRQYIPLKCQYASLKLHGTTSQKTLLFGATTMKIANLCLYFYHRQEFQTFRSRVHDTHSPLLRHSSKTVCSACIEFSAVCASASSCS
jgi:hypothetical protein